MAELEMCDTLGVELWHEEQSKLFATSTVERSPSNFMDDLLFQGSLQRWRCEVNP